jgi:starch phosphorylase
MRHASAWCSPHTRRFAESFGLGADALVRLGQAHPDREFGVSELALRMSRAANAVSRRHGEVARAMWQQLWPERPVEAVPITHVTNGVHVPTWIGDPMRDVLDRCLGSDWMRRAVAQDTWTALDRVSDADLWAARRQQRTRLVDLVRERSVSDRLARGEDHDYAEAAARAFDPDVLTIGFARRVATYKRLGLLVADAERAVRLLSGNRPIQIVLAGKAHPSDEDAKRVIEGMFSLKGEPGVGGRVAYLHDYDLSIADRLVQGCDVWVNIPRPPLEASGTSGMKSAVNGGLQLSVLDGWWVEGYDGTNGWALSGEVDEDHAAQDARDSAELYELLEREVIPAFYTRDGAEPPRQWLSLMRSSLSSIVPAFCASRMLDDYASHMYARDSELRLTP